jgi:uncharacterized protein YaiI (UPF0178 family)
MANLFSVYCLFVASYAHIATNPFQTPWKYVNTHKEAVDLYIMNHVFKGDMILWSQKTLVLQKHSQMRTEIVLLKN